MNTSHTLPPPVPRAARATAYSPPAPAGPIDLHLDANEGPATWVDIGAIASARPGPAASRYPSARDLERDLARGLSIDPTRVIVTAGGDEAIDRACRAFLEPGRELILPSPTFEMIGRYADAAGATVLRTPWPIGPYPIEEVLRLITPRTAMIALVSPNNPTGAVATGSDIARLSRQAPHALLLVDLAYAEFASEDLTAPALSLPNVLVVRTFSKAYGLAGLRVGYAAGPEPIVRVLRAVAGPYPVSGLSLAVAREALRDAASQIPARVRCAREERQALFDLLASLGARPNPSDANFVLARFDDAARIWQSLASSGISVRRFPPGSGLDDCLRITCPCEPAAFARLSTALRTNLGSTNTKEPRP